MKLGFVLEYGLGHITHADNLKRELCKDKSIDPIHIDIASDEVNAWWARLPGIRNNWPLKGSTAAYLALSPHRANLDALLFHTQSISVVSTQMLKSIPCVVSLDATPVQFEALGPAYGYYPDHNNPLVKLQTFLTEKTFHSASHLVTWSEWAKASLVKDYGIIADKVTVIHPGVDTDAWNFDEYRANKKSDTTKFLFVGGDFVRKGGDTLLASMRDLPPGLNLQLDIVTKDDPDISGLQNVRIHKGLTANSKPLMDLYAEADVLVFPTRADCFGLVLLEALAAGLPVITTNVGAVPEVVTHDLTGLIIPPDDSAALGKAICHLATSPEDLRRMSASARSVALERFDAATNYQRLINVVKSVVR